MTTPAMKRLMPKREVYFVQAQTLGLIKIGLASSARDRMRNLTVCSPDRLKLLGVIRSPTAHLLEEELHARFAADRDHGEWFRPSAGLLAFIAGNVRPDGEELLEEVRAGLEAAYG